MTARWQCARVRRRDNRGYPPPGTAWGVPCSDHTGQGPAVEGRESGELGKGHLLVLKTELSRTGQVLSSQGAGSRWDGLKRPQHAGAWLGSGLSGGYYPLRSKSARTIGTRASRQHMGSCEQQPQSSAFFPKGWRLRSQPGHRRTAPSHGDATAAATTLST